MSQLRKLFLRMGAWNWDKYLGRAAIATSAVAVWFTWRSYQLSLEMSKPVPRVEVIDVITSEEEIGGFSYSMYWVRFSAMNVGVQATTLLRIEPDSCCHWLLSIDSLNIGRPINNRVAVYMVPGLFSNYRGMPLTDTLNSLPLDDYIHIGQKIESGGIYNMNLGIRVYTTAQPRPNSIQLHMVAVFSDGTRKPFTEEWFVRS